jgi:hypothetical protein
MEPPVAVPAVLPFLEGNGDPFGMDNIRRNFQFAMGSMEHLLRRSTQLSDHLNLRRTTRATDDARRSTIMVVNGMNRASHFNSEADSSASSSFGSEMLDVEMSGPEEGSATDASYQAPPTPPLGFTRTPTVNDVLVCPNCDEELCVGDDDVAKQVWAIKACGHVRTLVVVSALTILGVLRRVRGQPLQEQAAELEKGAARKDVHVVRRRRLHGQDDASGDDSALHLDVLRLDTRGI